MAASAAVHGVYAAILTPFDAQGRPDVARFTDFAGHLLANGCDGLAPLGTTGEANSISVSRKIAFIEAIAAAGLPMQRMIVGTGNTALADAVALSQAAIDAGAQGILVLPPYYYKSPSEDGLFAFFSELAQQLRGAPRIYLYHFPQMSAVPITLELTARLLREHPGVFVGMKDSSGDFTNTKAFIEHFPGFEVFSGTERFLLDTLRADGAGCISASTNVTAHLAQKVLRAWREGGGDEEQQVVSQARLAIQGHPLVAAMRAAVAALMRDEAWLDPLPPLTRLDDAAAQDLLGALARLEGFDSLRTYRPSAAE